MKRETIEFKTSELRNIHIIHWAKFEDVVIISLNAFYNNISEMYVLDVQYYND